MNSNPLYLLRQALKPWVTEHPLPNYSVTTSTQLFATSMQKRTACFATIPVYKNYGDEKKKLNYSGYLQCGRTDNYPAARDTSQNVNAVSSANRVQYCLELQNPVCLICWKFQKQWHSKAII